MMSLLPTLRRSHLLAPSVLATAAGIAPEANPDAPDRAADAPRAGSWFHDYFLDLVKNAAPPL